ncbi:glutamate--tRNA ligase family protein [Foetidibacter luteolus]|uniref:glutamate--tRNA ligase family protein n=1 Tax=Foetidibacter luteolus TaxID=2608880 RepID=UPI00129AA50F|nr:glutamate--tRNA ligase family protein [Foetidibacter luteolus]
MSISYYKTRIAPTPSGYLHLGNIFSFALTTKLAKQTGASVLLRIDDLDQARANSAYLKDIFDTLNFLNITWQQGPASAEEFEAKFSQVHRMHLYNQALDFLQSNGHVFACTCSRTEILKKSPVGTYPGTCLHKSLPLNTPNASWRLRTSATQPLLINNYLGNPASCYLPASMQYFIVRKKDGFPSYQLASLLDDVYYEVDLIVRGQDLWPSTVAQHYLSLLLPETAAFRSSAFHHHPLIMEPGGKKLSKSAGAVSIQYLRKQGKTADDIYSMINDWAHGEALP